MTEVCGWRPSFSYWFVHLQLHVVPVAEQFVGPRGGELLCSVS